MHDELTCGITGQPRVIRSVPDDGMAIILTASDDERIAVQCKHWKTWNVGVKMIREFLGALKDPDIQNGIVITLRGYTYG